MDADVVDATDAVGGPDAVAPPKGTRDEDAATAVAWTVVRRIDPSSTSSSSGSVTSTDRIRGILLVAEFLLSPAGDILLIRRSTTLNSLIVGWF